MGLSLALKIVRLHKGNISVVSQSGHGTTFTAELPHV
ncbi:HAMP domain-containing histidine kinase [Chitinophaga oryzae]|uniref:HAMP domain-containing histidine kinase n=1 Tax=Chitinophaga oryzae TaxID=2725414 RepID=A0AAE6ZNS0_9BACT|nr:HAMP domain-containing histidine kinase [Chitinophaga oryzae]QJB39054.2 HAMP domain-containing histidine kinase [Chitinophaga oryzae]